MTKAGGDRHTAGGRPEPAAPVRASIDAAVSSLVLHQFEDCSATLAELHRVLKLNGCLILAVNHPVVHKFTVPPPTTSPSRNNRRSTSSTARYMGRTGEWTRSRRPFGRVVPSRAKCHNVAYRTVGIGSCIRCEDSRAPPIRCLCRSGAEQALGGSDDQGGPWRRSTDSSPAPPNGGLHDGTL